MSEITAALDEPAANRLFATAIAALPRLNASDSGSLGPFIANYSVTARVQSGLVDLIAPDTIRIADFRLNWNIALSFGFDLSSILPDFTIPPICFDLGPFGEFCIPEIGINWPEILIPVAFGDFLEATADFTPDVTLDGGRWHITAVVRGVPELSFGPKTALLLQAIGLAATPVLLAVPFLGPFLAIAVNAIMATIGLAGVTGFLGPILTPFVSGLQIPIYDQPQQFPVLPSQGPFDPKVEIRIDTLAADVRTSDEDELVLTADISP